MTVEQIEGPSLHSNAIYSILEQRQTKAKAKEKEIATPKPGRESDYSSRFERKIDTYVFFKKN
jgi:hypothetical protein